MEELSWIDISVTTKDTIVCKLRMNRPITVELHAGKLTGRNKISHDSSAADVAETPLLHWNKCQCILCGLILYRLHYTDVIMSVVASHITSLTIVYSIVYSDADQRKHQSSASLAFVWGIHRGPVNSPHKWPIPPKMFPFDDVIRSSFEYVFSQFRSGSYSYIWLPVIW